MDRGLFGCDIARIHQLLDLGVVNTDLREPALAEQVCPGVADVHDQPVRQAHLLHHYDPGKRGSSPAAGGITDRRIGLEQASLQLTCRGSPCARGKLRGSAECPDAYPAGDLPRFMAAHAVGHREHGIGGYEGIFIQFAAQATVRSVAIAQLEAGPAGGGKGIGVGIGGCRL